MKKPRIELPQQDYRSLFDNASDAIWIHDINGNIIYANKAAERLTGYSQKELTGMSIFKFLADDKSHEKAREVRNHLLKGEEIKQPYEQHIIRRDGSTTILKMATSLVISDGKVSGFQHIARDATEERRLQENMRFYVREIIRAQEDERKRIAREIHDDVSPSLLLLIQRIDAIASNPNIKLSDWFNQKLEGLRCQTVEALESLRRIAQDLRPRILDDLGLIPALEWMTENLIMHHGIEAQVEVKGTQQDLPSEMQLLLFRIAQEALNNIRRHTKATMALVTLKFGDDKTVLTISDNGQGFALPERIGDMTAAGKLGLAGMQERAQLLGGSLEIRSEQGKGTTVIAEAPNQCSLGQIASSRRGFETLTADTIGDKIKS